MKYNQAFFACATALATFFCVPAAKATPVEIDTPDAHIVIVRPIDQWSGNRTTSKKSLVDHARKHYFVRYFDESGKMHAIMKTIFSGVSDEGIFPDLVKSLPDGSVDVRALQFGVSSPVRIAASDLGQFLNAQRSILKSSVVALGNPATLEDRNDSKAALMLIAKLAGDAAGGQAYFWTHEASNAPISASQGPVTARLTSNAFDLASVVNVPQFELSGYNEIEIRNVSMGGDRRGQMFVAYKHPKTREAEDAALLAALPVLMGFDETEAQIEAARRKDFELREAVWKECVGMGQCKDEESVTDVEALPTSNQKVKDAYRDWLKKRKPRAFVLTNDGHYNDAWGGKDPAKRALDACNARGQGICRLYAVDDQVVSPN